MKPIIEFFRDPAWNGVAGLTGVITLAFFLLDRYARRFRSQGFIIRKILSYILSILAFAYYGVALGCLSMFIAFAIASFINIFAAGQGSVPSPLGEFLLYLSNIEFLVWGFNKSIPILSLQFGAAGLWFGSLIGLLLMAYQGYVTQLDLSLLPDSYHLIAFIMFIGTSVIGVINAWTMLV